ncbi:unnamed protein product [Didymodactylos carnosus]|uniref:Integrase catalytic domain-containing protein n=1 Tax=Didymodactylos carnosus TaxID=1234261 RepID=A0A814M2Z9_9BILA|nr:unnamed protein product [Didymodactylos carnosus]CAF1071987.1 unnamed protein product [Didymodactylos carnosus]CAF3712671.1 unnamed protein product [Didymodactylos carnosus]CAF3838976.1 unnamed protein product [Didymodactylos carnosus]
MLSSHLFLIPMFRGRFSAGNTSSNIWQTKKQQLYNVQQSPPHSQQPCEVQSNESSTSTEIYNTIKALLNHLPQAEQDEVYLMLLKHQSLCELTKRKITNTHIQHVIRTGDHSPISSRPFLSTIHQQKTLSEHIHQMEKDHFIRRSTSLWVSPVALVKKPDGAARTNGQVERFNATFYLQLAKLHDENVNHWDEYLPACIFAYNSRQHGTTGSNG